MPATISCCRPVLEAPLAEDEAADLAELFKVLADPARLRLLSLIAERPERTACACELVGALDRSQPTVSHHLKVLTDAGLLERERRGRWVWYAVRTERLDELARVLDLP